jgi:hypothetical protein
MSGQGRVKIYNEWNAPRTVPGLRYVDCADCGIKFATTSETKSKCDICICVAPLRLKLQHLEAEVSRLQDEVAELKMMARE